MGSASAFAGIDQEDPFRVVDDEDPDGLPLAVQAAGDPAGGEEMEFYRPAVGRQLDGCGREHTARYRLSDNGRIESGQLAGGSWL